MDIFDGKIITWQYGKEMIEIATNKTFAENYAQKHNADAKFGR